MKQKSYHGKNVEKLKVGREESVSLFQLMPTFSSERNINGQSFIELTMEDFALIYPSKEKFLLALKWHCNCVRIAAVAALILEMHRVQETISKPGFQHLFRMQDVSIHWKDSPLCQRGSVQIMLNYHTFLLISRYVSVRILFTQLQRGLRGVKKKPRPSQSLQDSDWSCSVTLSELVKELKTRQ